MAPIFPRRVELVDQPSESQTETLLALDRREDSNFPPCHSYTEQFGLLSVYIPTPQVLEALPAAHHTDIIAVHGFGGDAYRTWQHENGYSWLHHLHEQYPGVRVYTYGYDSGMAFGFGTVGLTNYARHLLSLIKLTRGNTTEEGREIMFVCHGLGGLLVKQAILLLSNEQGIFRSIYEAKKAILFFGTPHSGTYLLSYEDVLLNFGMTLMFPTLSDALLDHFTALFFINLQQSVSTLEKLAEEFRIHASEVPVASFVEDVPLRGTKRILVDETSATVGLKREHVVPMLKHDHRQLCKHPSSTSGGMRLIYAEIQGVMGPKTLTKACQTSNEMVNSVHLATRVPALRSRELALLQAVADGNLSAVQRLIKSGTDCNSRNNDHNSALHIACEHDHVAIGLYLIQSGAYIVAANNQGNQALHLAAKGNGTLVSAILKRGGELNAQNSDGWTPLHFAAKANNSDIITQLLECGARWTIRNNGNELPVRVARKALALDAMKVLHGAMKIGPHESLVQQISSYHSAEDSLTRDERSSIYMHQNFPSVVSINFDMDIRVKRQASEIAQSARRGNLAAVEDMLDTGIIPPPDALYLAASESRSKVVEVLADVMEDLDTGVGWAGNALCAAASHTDGHNTMKILLDKGANVNWQGGKYGCPLQTATANYRLENVKLLLSYGADVNAQCGHYGNALTAAARHQTNFEEMATLFLDLGVDIDAQGPGAYGNPLQTAVHRHHVQNVKFLLYHGANPKVEGRFGSALDIARRNLSEEGYVGNRREKDEILFLLTEDELESLAITDE